jgi:hypothetical protein
MLVRAALAHMILEIVGYGIEGFVRFVLYSFILWIMIKIQKFNYNWPGLLLVSGASIAISYIPWVGPYLAYPVLIFGLRSVTGADIAPDIIFTVGITRAVMFCVNLFIIGALMGDLRPDLNASARTDGEEAEMAEVEDEEEEESAPQKEAGPSYTLANSKHPKAKDLTLRGISINSSRAMAIVGAGRNFHTVSTGECFKVQSGNISTTVRCDEITKSFVLLTLDGTDHVKLQMH